MILIKIPKSLLIRRIGIMTNFKTNLNYIQLANKHLEYLKMFRKFKSSLIVVLKCHKLIPLEIIISSLR